MTDPVDRGEHIDLNAFGDVAAGKRRSYEWRNPHAEKLEEIFSQFADGPTVSIEVTEQNGETHIVREVIPDRWGLTDDDEE